MEMPMNSGQHLAQAVQHYRAGRLGQAEALCRDVIKTEPRNPVCLHLLGVIAFQLERYELAIKLIRSALVESPMLAAAHCHLGRPLQATGQMDEAAECYRRAIHLQPDLAEAHINLGAVLLDQDKPAEALPALQRALQLKPDAGTLANLGVALQRLGRLDEAVICHRQAVQQMPASADVHNYLGSALHEQGKLDEAAASYEQALILKPDHIDALTNLGLIMLALGNIDESIARQEQVVRLKPNYAPAHNNLGAALAQRGKLDEAIASYARALQLKPNYADAHRNLGRIRLTQGKPDEALVCYQHAARLQPNSPMAYCELGNAFQELGDFPGAEHAFRTALQLDPQNATALWCLATQQRGERTDADLDRLEQRLADPNVCDIDASKIRFALAHVCDAKGDYERAAGHLKKANALQWDADRKDGKHFQPGQDTQFTDKLMATFTPEFFERTRGFGLETSQPVFIFGLPRSGTTLTEQILAAHSQVFGAGELFLAQEDFQSLRAPSMAGSPFAALAELQPETVRRLAQDHLELLWSCNRTAERIVDKMPGNYQYLGLLAVLFPRAAFIHCRRDLRDVALSCWMNPLPIPWTNRPEHIVAHFREYQRQMEHWCAVLPIPILEISYEETVADLEGTARRLVDFCGLDWEPACLKFNEGNRAVRTISKVQVREPVYARSVVRWRHYERNLIDLFTALTPLQDKEKSLTNATNRQKLAATAETPATPCAIPLPN